MMDIYGTGLHFQEFEKQFEAIEAALGFGHWEIIFKLPDKTAEAVVDTQDALERKWGEMFKQVFKSITVDNGSEFAYCEGLERSVLEEGGRGRNYTIATRIVVGSVAQTR